MKALEDAALSKRDRAASFVNRGIVHMHRKEFTEALADYEAALGINADLAEAHTNRGIALWYAEVDNREALAALTRGLELDTTSPEVAYYTRAAVNEALGNVKAAYYDYKEAAEISPRWALPQEQLKRFKVIG